jgi:C1A family cysteine protease
MVLQQKPKDFVDLSRLFIYYNSRLVDGTLNEDSGAYLRDTIKSTKKYGICSEALWPYNTEKFTVEPPAYCYEDAKSRNIANYHKIDSLDGIIDALNNNKPVVFGMLTYRSFDDLSKYNSIVSMPEPNEEETGAHAMCFMGYDQNKKLLLAKNSFGTEWGDNGYCWIPFGYVDEYIYDIWVFGIS